MEGWEKKSYGWMGGECIMTEYEKWQYIQMEEKYIEQGSEKIFLKMGENDIQNYRSDSSMGE